MYKRVVEFNNGLYEATTVQKLDEEVELLTNYVNSLDIKNDEIRYFQNNIIQLYDKYKDRIMTVMFDDVMEKFGMSRIFTKPNKTELPTNEQSDNINKVIGKTLDKINSFYKI